uniref:F-box domain-containing protein n=1 Tax=Fagus sylvatica TaxID=28930 RepID=A0A2N9F2Z7_FAGSY
MGGLKITGWSTFIGKAMLENLPLVYNETLSRITGAILISNGPPNLSFRENFHCPCLMVRLEDAREFLSIARNGTKPLVSIEFRQTFMNSKPAPVVPNFASRGPSLDFPCILKPDAMAPEWSPAAIKSAIITTANTVDNTLKPILEMSVEIGISPPIDMGAGQIDPNKALDPGATIDKALVTTPESYDITISPKTLVFSKKYEKQFYTVTIMFKGRVHPNLTYMPRNKSKGYTSKRLPYDVVYDILTLLPVKSLIRFRCVFKSWNSIITDPIFITSHLNRAKSLSNNNNGYLLYTPKTDEEELCTVVYNSDHTLTEISSFVIPFSDVCIAGFCNGIFCLNPYYNEEIILWNPSIRKFKMLTAGTTFTTPCTSFHGKNVRPVEAEVFTLSTDSWRKVALPVESITGSGSNFVFFNGALHIMDDLVGFCPLFECIAVFKGLLALFSFGDDLDDITGVCNIWVMREYGVVESWTKKCVPMDLVQDFYGCTDNGELLIENETGFVSFDPESLYENILAIEVPQWVGYTTNSIESLVLLDGQNVSLEYED